MYDTVQTKTDLTARILVSFQFVVRDLKKVYLFFAGFFNGSTPYVTGCTFKNTTL